MRGHAARNMHSDRTKLGGNIKEAGRVHTPVNPGTRCVEIPKSMQVRISASSKRRTYSMTPNVFSFRLSCMSSLAGQKSDSPPTAPAREK